MKEKKLNKKYADFLYGKAIDILSAGAYCYNGLDKSAGGRVVESCGDRHVVMSGNVDDMFDIDFKINPFAKATLYTQESGLYQGDKFKNVLRVEDGELHFLSVYSVQENGKEIQKYNAKANLSQGTSQNGTAKDIDNGLCFMGETVFKVGNKALCAKQNNQVAPSRLSKFGEMVGNVAPYVLGAVAVVATGALALFGLKENKNTLDK